MVNDVIDRFKTNHAGADRGVAILRVPSEVFAVIYMEYSQPIQSNDFVELFHDTVEVIDNIIPGVVCMAGVKANGQFVIELYFVDNSG